MAPSSIDVLCSNPDGESKGQVADLLVHIKAFDAADRAHFLKIPAVGFAGLPIDRSGTEIAAHIGAVVWPAHEQDAVVAHHAQGAGLTQIDFAEQFAEIA